MNAIDWKKLLLPNIPYLLFVYLFDKVGQAVRLAPGADLSGKVLSLGEGFSMAFANPLPSLAPMDLLIGKTPQGWNANIFNMIQNLSENVIVPIAGLVITYVLCYELISMVTEKNNMHDVDTFMFFKWFFKAFVAVFLVTHTFDITAGAYHIKHRYFYPVHHAGIISDRGCSVLRLKCPLKQHDTLRPQAA